MMLCRITGKVCTAWSETAGCGLVRCKFVEDKGGDEGMTDRRKDCPMRHENSNCTVAGGFCTAVNNPICEALHNAFDCGYRSAIRQQEPVTNRNGLNEPTNADRINAMTIEEKAEFLSSISYGRETPWCEQFAEKFCKSCPTTTCTVEGYHHPIDLHECDFTDGKCPHGEDIVWWLQQPADEANHGHES